MQKVFGVNLAWCKKERKQGKKNTTRLKTAWKKKKRDLNDPNVAPTSLVRSKKPCSYVVLSGENTSETIAFLSVISVLGSRTLIGWPMVLNSQSTTASTHGQLLNCCYPGTYYQVKDQIQ